MNVFHRLFHQGNRQRIVRSPWMIGTLVFSCLLIFCVVGSYGLPMDPYESHGDLKNLAPARNYLQGASDLDAKDVEDIVSGRSFSAALQKDGRVLVWGELEDKDSLPNLSYQKIAAGNDHLLALDVQGKVYGIGRNTQKECELPEEFSQLSIADVFAKDGVSAVLTKDHRVVFWGNTKAYEDIPEDLQGKIASVVFGDTHLGLRLLDGTIHVLGNQGSTLTHVPDEIAQHTIVDIAFSNQEAIALDNSGQVFVWGERFVLPDSMKNIKMVKIAASQDALFALDEVGNIHTIGSGSFGETTIPSGRYQTLYADHYQIYGVQEERIVAWGNEGFLLGSDRYGRDILTRLVHGGLVTMGIGFIACIIEAILGVAIGLLAGYRGGWIDHMLMRVMEVIASLPFLPLVITLSAFLKDRFDPLTRMVMIMVLLGVLSTPALARLVRAQILVEREKSYVTASKVLGATTYRMLTRTLLPQVLPLVIVHLTLSYADNMMIESALSFLGFGVQPPFPTWGNMLEGAQTTFVLEHCWWQWLFPALAIFFCVFAINAIGEGIRAHISVKEVAS